MNMRVGKDNCAHGTQQVQLSSAQRAKFEAILRAVSQELPTQGQTGQASACGFCMQVPTDSALNTWKPQSDIEVSPSWTNPDTGFHTAGGAGMTPPCPEPTDPPVHQPMPPSANPPQEAPKGPVSLFDAVGQGVGKCISICHDLTHGVLGVFGLNNSPMAKMIDQQIVHPVLWDPMERITGYDIDGDGDTGQFNTGHPQWNAQDKAAGAGENKGLMVGTTQLPEGMDPRALLSSLLTK